MVAFDASGNVRWIVPGYGPKIATADGGVIAQAWVPDTYYQFAGPAVTFDQSGNATGQMNLPTYSWLGNAYQVGSVDQVVAAMAPYFALSFWAFEGGNASGNGTAVSNPQYPPLPTCTSSPGCIGPKEGIYNALDNLKSLLQDPTFVGYDPQSGIHYTLGELAQMRVFSDLGTDARGNPRYTTNAFIQYLTTKRPTFYDGLKSQYCNDELLPLSLLNPPCVRFLGKTWLGETVAAYFGDPSNSGTTAETGTPSNPLLTFFRPSAILTNSQGRNQANEGLLFHEALHGFTGLQDSNILDDLGYGYSQITASCNITIYIQQTVLKFTSKLDSTTNNVGCAPPPAPPKILTP
jgi:hypothetical protein